MAILATGCTARKIGQPSKRFLPMSAARWHIVRNRVTFPTRRAASLAVAQDVALRAEQRHERMCMASHNGIRRHAPAPILSAFITRAAAMKSGRET
jgi:hypothetical protein